MDTLEYSDNGRVCNRCPDDDESSGYLWIMTPQGCTANCDIASRPYEMLGGSRYECICIPGYYRPTPGA